MARLRVIEGSGRLRRPSSAALGVIDGGIKTPASAARKGWWYYFRRDPFCDPNWGRRYLNMLGINILLWECVVWSLPYIGIFTARKYGLEFAWRLQALPGFIMPVMLASVMWFAMWSSRNDPGVH